MSMRYARAALPMGVMIAMAAAAVPMANAQTQSKTLTINGVSNNTIECIGASATNNENCVFDSLPKMQCPPGELPVSVTVVAGPPKLETCIDATNSADFSSCYNIREILHEELKLDIAALGISLNGSPPPLNTGGSGQDIGDAVLGPCETGFPETLFTYRRPSGGVVKECVILGTTVPSETRTYAPSDADWDEVYGPSGELEIRYAARADTDAEFSGTWKGGVETKGSGGVSMTLECVTPTPTPTPTPSETPRPKPVPVAGSLGVGALAIALSGAGLLVGFRRRR